MESKKLNIIDKLHENIEEGTLLYEALPLLRDNIGRIEFFKISSDYSKPAVEKNFLVLLEKSTDYILSLINMEHGDSESNLHYFNNVELEDKPASNLLDTLKFDLLNFFKNSDETLYVSISFETQLVSDFENWELYETLNQAGHSNNELLKSVLDKTKYPNWFNPIYEEKLDSINLLFDTMEDYDELKMKSYIDDIDEELKKSLLKEDYETAKELVDIVNSTKKSFDKENALE